VKPPERLVAFQAAFSALLRAPLRAEGGTLHADPEACPEARRSLGRAPPPTAAATPLEARLALYQEQVWKRFFVAFHEQRPRFCRALGYWRANQVVMAWLARRPPAAHDLGELSQGFLEAVFPPDGSAGDPELLAWVAGGPRPLSLLRECLYLDTAQDRAFRSPWAGVWQPGPDEQGRLLTSRLRRAPSLTVLQLRQAPILPEDLPLEGVVPPLAAPRLVVVARTPQATAVSPVDAVLARLLSEASRRPLGEVLAQIEADCPPALRAALGEALPGKIHRALREGWWIGLEPA
jgi:hypothetical protein